ncbi:MAG: FAD-dependent oxidoreductase [bacterium]|nr:MAG: FAD-dependent oxidoreductase [bacterium]
MAAGQRQGAPTAAVVGGGVAGIVAAHLLQRVHQVTLFEANDYLGGHTHTVIVPDGPDAGTPVDTGFIVHNDRTYPLLRKFLSQLNVSVRDTGMSFSFHDRVSGLAYSSRGLRGLFAQPANLLRPGFWRMLEGIARFCRDGTRLVEEDRVPDVSLGRYLEGRYPGETVHNFILPMASAIWSASMEDMEQFPAASFLRFYHNHGLLTLTRQPRWMTIVGGSRRYVEAFEGSFTGSVHLGTPVVALRRENGRVRVRTAAGQSHTFDRVVVAAHADDALKMLEDPSDEERRLLGSWRYRANRTVLHTDTSVLPPVKGAWAAWNYCRERAGSGPVSVSYSMNILQGLRTSRHYCVSLNRQTPIDPGAVIAEMTYHHPVYTFVSTRTQPELPSLNGIRNTWFCGSYFGYGFHEDAVRSAVEVGRALGVEL